MTSFSKFEAAGNDFIVIDDQALQFPFQNKKFIQKLCHRKFGIGADGILLVQKAKNADYKMRILNADGSLAAMCGNGLRCVTLFLSSVLKKKKQNFLIESEERLHRCLIEKGKVKTELGFPIIHAIGEKIAIGQERFEVHFLNTGVPHAVVFTSNIQEKDFENRARKLRFHPFFGKEGANVNLVQILSKEKLLIRTYERGVEGETFSCGTGAAAAFAISKFLYHVKNQARLVFSSGSELSCEMIEDKNKRDSLFISGECHLVFDGKLDSFFV